MPQDDVPPAPGADGHEDAPSTIRSPASGAVLVVDPGEGAATLVDALRGAGHHAVACASVAEAALLLAETVFDVVIAEASVEPEGDGRHLAELRFVDPEVSLVLTTLLPSLKSATLAVELRATRYLPRHLVLARLADEMQRAIAASRRERRQSEAGRGQDARRMAELATHFDDALETLSVVYQPIASLSTAKVVAYETFLRTASKELPTPLAVLAAAERLRRVTKLGRAVRERAVAPLASAPSDAELFVNLHAIELDDPQLLSPDAPLAAAAHRVVLELTERATVGDVGACRARVDELRARGYRFAIDDLGSGFSDLTHVAELAPEFVKLDVSLVRGIETSRARQKVVGAITSVCRDLGATVVAEGVETFGELSAVRALGCDWAQGYHIAPPGPAFPEVRAAAFA